MKNYRILLMLVLSAGINYSVFGQGQSNTVNQVTPRSPELAQLGKFGNIPVSHSTGSASVQIPVFTINTPRFNWPIALSYHTSGIRVDEVPSSVGSGWGLDVISAVSRSIKGKPDEYGILTNTIPYKTSTFSMLSLSEQKGICESVDAGTDTEPDEFSFNFHGKSGNFQLNREKGVVLQSDDNLKIYFNQGQIRIIDEIGNTYFFDSYESGASRVYPLLNNPSGLPIEQYDGITGWFLTKVLSQDKADSIVFQYATTYTVNQEQDQYSYKVGEISTVGPSDCLKGVQHPIIQKTGIQKTSTLTPELSAIIYKEGKLVLNYEKDRKDMGVGLSGVGNMGRLVSIDIYQNKNNVYQIFQKFRLHQSYSISPTKPTDRDSCYAYRLRLDSTSVVDKNDVKLARAYRLEYNSIKLPYRTSPNQDLWGFANGANNINLVPRRIISWSSGYGSIVADIGTANRNADSLQMQAGSLSKIYYPTGGYTSFEYGAHKFYDPSPAGNTISTIASEMIVTAVPGSPNNIASKRFTQTAASETVSVNAFFKAYYGKSDAPPYVKIKKWNGSVFVDELVLSSPDAHNDRSVSGTYTLVNGNEYKLEAYVHAGSYPVNEVYATGKFYRDSVIVVPGSPGGDRIVGGLRIQSVSNYSDVMQLATKETYKYGNNGAGTLIAHYEILNRDYMNVTDNVTEMRVGICVECAFKYRRYTDQSPYGLSSLSGSPVGYTNVTKTIIDNSGNNLGKEEFIYDIVPDDFDVIPGIDNYYPISRNWRNGKIITEKIYKSLNNGNLYEVQSKVYNYQDLKKDTVNYLVIQRIHQDVCYNTINNYTIFQGRKYYGKRLPLFIATTIRNQDASGNTSTLVDTTWHEYSNTSAHNYPTKITTKGSSGKFLQQNFYYAQDMISKLGDNGGGVYDNMVLKGMTGMLILKRDYNAATLTKEIKTEFSSPFSGFIKPFKEFEKNGAFTSELLRTYSYGDNANLLSILEERGPKISYKWGYQEQFPIAEVKNSAVNEFYIQNFEEGGGITGNAHTGDKFYNGSYTVNWVRPNARAYKLGYFYYNSGVWAYKEEDYITDSKLLSGGSAYDDIRIYPQDALMTTYTYEPMFGMTSQTDVKGITTYYEYDGLQRLKHIKDQNGHIIKSYDYHYKP